MSNALQTHVYKARRIMIINGFDRSGTSYVGGVLEHHPDVKYFFQPDNGSPLHRRQWEYWEEGIYDERSYAFMKELGNGRINQDYIVSDWFKKYGCGEYNLDPQKLNLIKSTKLHLKVRWLRQFKHTEVMAIIRDPRATVASLVRNDFHTRWYGPKDYEAACRLVAERPLRDAAELGIAPPGTAPSPTRLISFLVLVRTAYMCHDLGWRKERIIFYEHAVKDPDGYLTGMLGLSKFAVSRFAENDFNIIGDTFRGISRGWQSLRTAEREEVDEILTPLCWKLGYRSEVGSLLCDTSAGGSF
jgi:hypothetical protein